MTETAPSLPAPSSGTALTRFNALRHGVLSRYTVLPWEDQTEYQDLLSALVSEHRPSGPTEEHLVEELAGILWRKRRLRLAEGAAEDTASDFADLAADQAQTQQALATLEAGEDGAYEQALAVLRDDTREWWEGVL